KKTKPPVDLFSVLEIPKGDYDIPTLKSKNRYIPYGTDKYRGKRYIYLEGDSGTDSGYTDHYSDITSSSESEYEELDINDIYAAGSPKYKTLIEVVLEPSKRDTQSGDTIPTTDIPSDHKPTNKFTEEEWNQLKNEFISNMLQNTQNTELKNLRDNVDNNTHPNTLYFDKPEEKPFIMSIHDRNLFSGEEYNYHMTTNSAKNDLYSGSGLIGNNRDSYSGIDPTSGNLGSYSGSGLIDDNHGPYSGTDLINDALSGDHDIYDEILKRKENELFGTEHHPKRTNTYSVAKHTNSDPIMNQLDLFHKWLDRHRDMCEMWDKNNKEELLDKLKEKWENETHSGNKTSGNITPTSDIPSDIKTLNTDVSIQIDMDNPKPINQFTYVDSNLNLTLPSNPNLVENQNPNLNLVENNINPNHQNHNQVGDTNFVDTPTNVQIEMSVKSHKLVKEKYPISDMWDI
ncbi:erythrocyte membrane protein 1, EMP1, exon 2, partial [Plasmodium reichenowi]